MKSILVELFWVVLVQISGSSKILKHMEIAHGEMTALKQPVGHGSGGVVTTRILSTCLK